MDTPPTRVPASTSRKLPGAITSGAGRQAGGTVVSILDRGRGRQYDRHFPRCCNS